MSKIKERIDCESQAFDKLRKLLKSSGSYSNLSVVVGRAFQRAPLLVKEMESQIEGLSLSKKKSVMIDLVLDLIAELVDPSQKIAHLLTT